MSSTRIKGDVGRGVFAREATGLVREVSPTQAIFFNLANAPIGTVLVFSVVLGFSFFSGANILLGVLLAILGSIPVLLYYAFLTASMPRTGGDYVYTSRFIHPAIGFAASVSYAANSFLGAGIVAVFVGTLGIAPAFSIIGKLTGHGTFNSIATWAAGKNGSFIIAVVSLTLLALFMIRGTSFTLKITAGVWLAGLLSILMLIGILLTTSNRSFQHIFNGYVTKETGKNTDWYHRMISLANTGGLPHKSWFFALWGLIAIGMFGSGWFFVSTYIGGEIKSGRSLRRQVGTMLGGAAVNGALFLICVALFIHTFGYKFLSSISYLLATDPSKVPFFTGQGAHVVLFTGLSAQNSVIAIIFGLTFIAWAWILLPAYLFPIMRSAFAWSFDQILPAGLSQISRRTRTPVLLTVIVWALCILPAYLAAYRPSDIFKLYAFTFFGTALSTMFFAGIAAMLFPYRAPETYAASPVAKYRVAGLPAIVVVGAIGVLFTAFWCAAYAYFPEFGMHANEGLLVDVFGGIFVGSILVYYLSRYIRKSQGIPMEMAFSEIPPE